MWIFFAACGEVKVDTAVEINSGSFTVLTYNVHGLPPEITGDDTEARLTAIAPLLNQFDLVGLQEDFIDANHEILSSGSSHQESHRFSEPLEDRVYGSGLSVFSNLTTTTQTGVHYTECHGTVDSASDCLASKGFQWLKIEMANKTLHVYNTHMEAGGGPEDEAVRATQVRELIDHVNQNTGTDSVLLVGDTNLHPNDAVDQPLIDDLLQDLGLKDTCAEAGCGEPNHIDRIFYRSSNALDLRAINWSNEEMFQDVNGAPLSDHPAISVEFNWARPKN
jgi:endonuclease/exonuclease/phosphatase family metal-dependent hydrolase